LLCYVGLLGVFDLFFLVFEFLDLDVLLLLYYFDLFVNFVNPIIGLLFLGFLFIGFFIEFFCLSF